MNVDFRNMFARWAPPLLWMAVIFWLSTDTLSARHTGALLEPLLRWFFPKISYAQMAILHGLVRKGAHFGVYAVLAVLLMRAFGSQGSPIWRWRWALLSLLVVSAYALADEYHQGFTLHRTASVYDSLIDVSGGATALCVLWAVKAVGWRPRLAVPTPVLKATSVLPSPPASPS